MGSRTWHACREKKHPRTNTPYLNQSSDTTTSVLLVMLSRLILLFSPSSIHTSLSLSSTIAYLYSMIVSSCQQEKETRDKFTLRVVASLLTTLLLLSDRRMQLRTYTPANAMYVQETRTLNDTAEKLSTHHGTIQQGLPHSTYVQFPCHVQEYRYKDTHSLRQLYEPLTAEVPNSPHHRGCALLVSGSPWSVFHAPSPGTLPTTTTLYKHTLFE